MFFIYSLVTNYIFRYNFAEHWRRRTTTTSLSTATRQWWQMTTTTCRQGNLGKGPIHIKRRVLGRRYFFFCFFWLLTNYILRYEQWSDSDCHNSMITTDDELTDDRRSKQKRYVCFFILLINCLKLTVYIIGFTIITSTTTMTRRWCNGDEQRRTMATNGATTTTSPLYGTPCQLLPRHLQERAQTMLAATTTGTTATTPAEATGLAAIVITTISTIYIY
jgi:hypothetical protein